MNTPTKPLILRRRAVVRAAEAYLAAKTEVARLEDELAHLRHLLLEAIGDRPVARAGERTLIVTQVAGTPATPDVTITGAMVGQVIPGHKGRLGYPRLEVR